MRIEKANIICVYIAMECWDSGLLQNFFYMLPQENNLPIYFMTDNCDFDAASNCYVFKIPRLHPDSPDTQDIHDVYIPREYVRGICVKHGEKSKQDMRMIGFQAGQKAAAAKA